VHRAGTGACTGAGRSGASALAAAPGRCAGNRPRGNSAGGARGRARPAVRFRHSTAADRGGRTTGGCSSDRRRPPRP
jgi:hypothetical protein